MNSNAVRLAITIVASLSFAACGGGNSGNSGTPPPTTYTIGGTVSGLSGTGSTGLSLQNGTDIFDVTANGSFTFSQPVASGGTYRVTIKSEPLNPVQLCLVTSGGSGTVEANVTGVQITCTSPAGKTLYNFGPQPDGSNPRASLVADSFGNLYGTTNQGGAYGNGTVFRLTPGNGRWTETVLYSFCPQAPQCEDGAAPQSSLVFDAAGNLYGTASLGGAYPIDFPSGVVFELMPQTNGTWTEKVLHTFGNGTDGFAPLAGLVFDNAGNLFGTTSGGGAGGSECFGGCGTIFELSPTANGQWMEKILYNFCTQANCVDGNDPSGVLTFDTAGNLYGTTVFGGTGSQNLAGTVFELTPTENNTWAETVLYSFQNTSTDGENPYGGVIIDGLGNLYGTTELGFEAVGINNGIALELIRGSGGQWKENVIYGFCASANFCSDGSSPYAGLVLDQSGNLYGTTWDGGTSQVFGVVFALASGPPNQMWAEVPLYSFPGAPSGGGNPVTGLIFDKAGNLYGTAGGGANGNGVVFEITP